MRSFSFPIFTQNLVVVFLEIDMVRHLSNDLTIRSLYREDFSSTYHVMGRTTSWMVCIFGIVYAITTLLGFLSLQPSQEMYIL